MGDYWVWCGSVIRGEDSRYHMFASRWPREYPFYMGYVVASEVVRAVADRPEGPYAFQEVVLPARGAAYWDGRMTHNPMIVRRGGQYLLFYIGTTYPGPRPSPDEVRPLGQARYPPAAPPRIGLAVSESIHGPWQRREAPVLRERDGAWDHSIVTNPSPCILEDERIFLLYRTYNAQVGAAVAEGTEAKFQRLGHGPVTPFNGFFGDAPIEDMFIWRTNGQFEMVAKDLTEDGHLSGERHAGIHATSADGLRWQISQPPRSYSRRVRWADGRETVQGCLERPFLLIEDGRPTHLFAATGDGPGGFDHCARTWNMVIPLKYGGR